MKNTIIVFVILITSAGLYQAQDMEPMNMPFEKQEKFRQMEKIKLLEALNLDEETAVRFFTRRNKNMENARKLIERRDKLIEKLADQLGNKNDSYKKITKEIMSLETELVENRSKFINSLEDILTEEQIAKLIVFENKFKKKIRNYFFRRHGMKHKKGTY